MTIRVTDETTRAEIEEALTTLARQAARIPRHHVEAKAKAHETLDVLLLEWEWRGE